MTCQATETTFNTHPNNQPKRKDRNKVTNFEAKFTSNNEVHGHDLPPPLNRLYCTRCGEEVHGKLCGCEVKS